MMKQMTLSATVVLALLFLPLAASAGDEPSAYIELGDVPIQLISATKAGDPSAAVSVDFDVVEETILFSGTVLKAGGSVLVGDEVIEGVFMYKGDSAIDLVVDLGSKLETVELEPGDALVLDRLVNTQTNVRYCRCTCVSGDTRERVYTPDTGFGTCHGRNGDLCELGNGQDGAFEGCRLVWRSPLAEGFIAEPIWLQSMIVE